MRAPAPASVNSVYEPPKTAGAAIKRLILPLYLPCWFDSVSMGIIGPVLPLFVLSLGATEALTGIVVSTVAAGRLAFSVPGGQLVGRIGEKRTIQFGLMVYTCSSILLALAPNVASIILARLLAGAGQQACGVGRQAFCAGAVATHHRGRVVGLLGGVSRIGGIAGPLIGGFVAQTWGFRAAFLLQASLNLVGVLMIRKKNTSNLAVACDFGGDVGRLLVVVGGDFERLLVMLAEVTMPAINAHDSPRGKPSPKKSAGGGSKGALFEASSSPHPHLILTSSSSSSPNSRRTLTSSSPHPHPTLTQPHPHLSLPHSRRW